MERRPLAVSAQDKTARRRNMVERYGLPRTVNKLLFNWVRSRFLMPSEAKTVRESFWGTEVPAYARQVPTLVVPNVNDARCIAFIQEHAPDVIAVCGTSVLKPEVFSLAPMGTVNIHTGITPEYRSADPIFWALYRGEPDKVGVTIHYIDRGIDTGPILHQETVPVYADDTLASIYVRCVQRGAELYKRALDEIGCGSARTISRPGVTSRAFLSVNLGLVQYVIFRWRFWRMAATLPPRSSATPAAAVMDNAR